MVMTFTLTPLSHYNSIIKHRARFLLSLMEDLTIDFPSYFVTSIIDVYQDTTTRDKLIFPSAITQILQHFSIPIPLSPLFTIMGAICAGSIRRSEAQLRLKRPPSSSTPPTSTPSSSTVGVTLDAIMEQLQRIHADFGGHLDYLTDEMCQMNTRIGRITRRQARIGGYGPFPSPSLECPIVSPSKDDEDDAGSPGDDEMTISQ